MIPPFFTFFRKRKNPQTTKKIVEVRALRVTNKVCGVKNRANPILESLKIYIVCYREPG